MEQMIKANNIELCYETFGEKQNPAILFVMGLGAQMTAWPALFFDALAEAGYYVIRYDNRDVGLSQKFDSAGMPDFEVLVADLTAGKKPAAPYYLQDMAADGMALLDELGIERVHVVGASMGGMIGQQMAIDYPQRLISFVSIFSTTGDYSLPPASEEAMAILTSPGPDTDDIEQLVDHALNNRRVVGGEGFVEAEQRPLAKALLERQIYPIGAARQRAAIMASGPRTEALRKLEVPTLVLHGDQDPLVNVAGGRHTAEMIPNAKLEILEGMGHALYPLYQPRILNFIQSHIGSYT